MCAVQSARTLCNSAASLTPKARSMSDHRSSRASAAEPVIAAPLIRWSLAAYSRSSDRRRARSSGVNMSASNLLLRDVLNSTVQQGLHDGGSLEPLPLENSIAFPWFYAARRVENR